VSTSTNVFVVETDVGPAYLKALGNPAGPHALASELIGTQLARLLSMQTFDYAVLDVQPENELPFNSDSQALPGPAFATREKRGGDWGGDARRLKKLTNPADIAKLVVMDTWLLNSDRCPPPSNTSRRPNYDNVFLSTENRSMEKFTLVAMDFSHCFSLVSGGQISPRIANIDNVKNTEIFGLYPAFSPILKRRQHWIGKALAALDAVDEQAVARIVEEVPAQWELQQSARSALVRFICDRADYLKNNIHPGFYSQPDLSNLDETK
jgi:hypothetical protein